MTLDMAMCEWCPTSTPATGTLHYYDWESAHGQRQLLLCIKHGNEAASEFTSAEYTLNPYNTWEDSPAEAMDIPARFTEELEKLGIPYPVSGDATTIRGSIE